MMAFPFRVPPTSRVSNLIRPPGAFTCNLCKKFGNASNGVWHCLTCQYDAHPQCLAARKVRPVGTMRRRVGVPSLESLTHNLRPPRTRIPPDHSETFLVIPRPWEVIGSGKLPGGGGMGSCHGVLSKRSFHVYCCPCDFSPAFCQRFVANRIPPPEVAGSVSDRSCHPPKLKVIYSVEYSPPPRVAVSDRSCQVKIDELSGERHENSNILRNETGFLSSSAGAKGPQPFKVGKGPHRHFRKPLRVQEIQVLCFLCCGC